MDFLTELTKEVVSKLGDLVVESTIKHFRYMIHHKNIIANLKDEHEKLKGMKEALQGMVDAKRRNGHEIAPNVQKWLYDVGAIENELQIFYENEVNNNKKCFNGKCPNLTSNYSLGKRATKRIEYIASLKEEENKFQHISYPKAPPLLGSTFAEDITSLKSRNKIIAEIIEKLKDDMFKRISVYGMGGVGKTTLIKELIQIVEKNKIFNRVVMAVVSQNRDYEKIQSQIADGLGLGLTGQSIEGRVRQILQRLNEIDKVLIVLDDVWHVLDFEYIGLPSQKHQKGCKILFTSREETVCRKMGSQGNFLVSILSNVEAWYLFQVMAGDVVNKPDIHPIAEKVVKECGGLPLAIVIVGKALQNEEKPVWEEALEQLRNSQPSSFSDVEEIVYSRIELSFKFLGSDEHRFFLMLCSLFPEDFDIPIENLLRHAMGLGLFKVVGAPWKARNRVNTLIGNLKRCFLLMDGDMPGCVKMHDVVRDVVISIASRAEHGFMVQHSIKRLKEEKLNHIIAISLILPEIEKLENGLECSTLQLLQVWSQSWKPKLWLEHFCQGMSNLRVLAMKKLCIPKLSSLSQALVNLHTLQIEYCDVRDISIIGKELIHLEILSFAYSNIEELPTEIGNLSSLRLLDLTECNDLNFISANIFSRLSQLEELYFRIQNFPWKKNDVVIKGLQNMTHQLKVVEMKIAKAEILPKDLDFKNLEKFWIYMASYTLFQRFAYLESNVLQITATYYNSIKSSLMTLQLIKRCEILLLNKVQDLKNVICELDDSGLQYLKDLRVDSCPDLEYVIDCGTPCCAFALIKSLSLNNLTKLREIFCSFDYHKIKKSMSGFSELEKLELKDLPNFIGFDNNIDLNEPHQTIHHVSQLSYSTNAKLFSFNWMKTLQELKTILLKKCISLEMVFDLHGYSQSNGRGVALLFPQLKEIEISYLNNLRYVWGNVPHHVQGFQNLRSLTISDCDSLRYVFTSSIVRAIVNLEKLIVSFCKSMENLIVWSGDNEEDNSKGKGQVTNVVFNKLYYVYISMLPKLVSSCSDSLKLECPSLRKFQIYDCPMLEISLLPIQINAKRDNLDVAYYTNTEDTSHGSFNKNNSRSSDWPLRCMPFLPKFIPQRSTNKRSSKEVSLSKDHIPSICEMERQKEKAHMPFLEDLWVEKCDSLDVLFFLEAEDNFTVPSHLKTIKIEDCDNLETIMIKSEEKKDAINSFAQLKSLHLEKLPNLLRFCFSGTNKSLDAQQDTDACEGNHKRIRHHPFIVGSLFPNLTSLFIKACNKIGILFSHSCLSSIEHLEKLEVRHCKNMEEIVSQEEIKASANKIMFPGLQLLILVGLPNLKAFSEASNHFNLPSLQKVVIKDCPNMEVFARGSSYTPKLEDVTINIERHSSNYIQKKDLNITIQGFKAFVALQESEMLRWIELHNKGIFGYFINDSKINIMTFHKLSKLISFDEIQMLQHARKLTLQSCASLVKVFELEGGEGAKNEDAITPYQLEEMTLDDLPKLSHIWKDNIIGVVRFHKLTLISIRNCHSLKSLLSQSMARSLVQLQELRIEKCHMIEEIVRKEDDNTKSSNKVKILFPELKILRLEYLPKLECVCSGDYDYDLTLCDVGHDDERNNSKVQISFPQLKDLVVAVVPKLKCFYSGAYDYNIMVSSVEEYPKNAIFPHGNVTVKTPNLHHLQWGVEVAYMWFPHISSTAVLLSTIRVLGDLNLTIHYILNSNKYEVELQKLETFRSIEQDELLLGYFTRQKGIVLQNCHKLLNCIPSNMIHLFSHLYSLTVRKCGCLEEILETNDYESNNNIIQYGLCNIDLDSLPKLKHIWKNPSQVSSFRNLRYITIKQCHDLKYVFPDVSIAKSLPDLHDLCVYECNMMEEIIQNDPDFDSVQPKEAKIIFLNLWSIGLKKLPSLNCFCPSSFSCYVELPKCYQITIEECPNMETFSYYGILYTPSLGNMMVENTRFEEYEEVNEVIRCRKWISR